MILNQEVRFPLYSWSTSFGVNGVVFVDAGNPICRMAEGWGAARSRLRRRRFPRFERRVGICCAGISAGPKAARG